MFLSIFLQSSLPLTRLAGLTKDDSGSHKTQLDPFQAFLIELFFPNEVQKIVQYGVLPNWILFEDNKS